MEVTESRINLALQMTAAMAVEEICEREKIKPEEALKEFMPSATAQALFDKETGLWECGPSYVAEEFLRLSKIRKTVI